MKIFKVEVLGFDSLENRNPVYIRETRYFRSEEQVDIFSLEVGLLPKHQGYDGEIYPYVRYKEVDLE